MLTYKAVNTYQAEEMLDLLALWQQAGLLSRLDLAFARFLFQNAPRDSAGINSCTLLLGALLSHQVARGHVCLPLTPLIAEPFSLFKGDSALATEILATGNLAMVNGEAIPSPADLFTGLNLATLCHELALSGAVLLADAPGAPVNTLYPLVLHNQALYFYRYWQYEQQIATDLKRLMQRQALALPDTAELNGWLNELFPVSDGQSTASQEHSDINWQKLACVNTLRSQFSVITGGPGTGKTYTVVRLLALLQRLHANADTAPLEIKLAAPTGKAAARLKESIQAATASLTALPAAWQPAISRISAQSATLHKLLGVQAGTRQFKHHRAKPLALDVLIVDEASMVDIELMQALLAALPSEARLILLGDKDQLASVEAGAVLGQLCEGAEQGGYQPATFAYLQQFCTGKLPAWLQQPKGPAHLQHVVMLRESRRFTASSGIGALAKAVNQAALAELNSLFTANRYADIQLLQSHPEPTSAEEDGRHDKLFAALTQLCQQGFAGYWQAISARPAANCSQEQQDNWARAVLKAYQCFQLLTPVREGPFGVAGLNLLVQKALSFLPGAKESTGRHDSWYEGRPVMITANDYNLNLRNGDIGMVLTLPADGQKRAVFIDSDNKVRWILPSRLTEVATVFAMTVHKSQGSEFAHTVMVLPEHDNPVLSRELIYTGITRAAKQLTLVVPNWQVLQDAVKRKTVRAGGLRL